MALARDVLKYSKLIHIFDFTNVSNTGNLKNVCFSISVRTSKHYNPKFKWLRSKKFIPIDLPHTEKSKQEIRDALKNMGIYGRYWKSRPLTITTASEVIEPYTPNISDGKASVLGKASKGIQNLASASKGKIADITAIRKIKNYDLNFKKDIFVQEAQDIYINAHTVLMKNDPEELSKYVTERANVEMMNGMKNKTLKWKFIESLEPPVIVQSRASEVVTKTNLFAQITVRFHSKQSLAIYDRFGRLMFGSEILAKDVLEYVVFEKHINNEYGVWRLHAKIIPEWREPSTALTRTYRIEENVVEDDEYVDLYENDPEPEPEHTAKAEIVPSEAKPSS